MKKLNTILNSSWIEFDSKLCSDNISRKVMNAVNNCLSENYKKLIFGDSFDEFVSYSNKVKTTSKYEYSFSHNWNGVKNKCDFKSMRIRTFVFLNGSVFSLLPYKRCYKTMDIMTLSSLSLNIHEREREGKESKFFVLCFVSFSFFSFRMRPNNILR